MKTWKSDTLAVSRAGHDKDTLYVVLEEKDGFCYLCDGRLKPLEKLKKKKAIHLQKIIHLEETLLTQMSRIETDADIRRILKEYRQSQL